MAFHLRFGLACVLTLPIGAAAVPGTARAIAKYGDAEFECVAVKQTAAGLYGRMAFEAWADWEKDQDDAERNAALALAEAELAAAFDDAEDDSAAAGVDCIEQTATAEDLAAYIDAAAADIATEINTGLDLADKGHAKCGSALLRASASKIHSFLTAEGKHTLKVPVGGDATKRDEEQAKASSKFSTAWAAASCPTAATEADIESRIDALTGAAVVRTVVAQGLDDSEFQPVSPVGPIEYEGKTLNPRCGFDYDPDYHFFVKRGSANKVVMYYQGGGACWENLTCGFPVCKDGADPVGDDPDNFASGFGDLSNPANPFKDWNIVFVTYCTCDIHFGDAQQTYNGLFGPLNVSHVGFQNAKVVEKFARENFLNPEVVFVTGSSAGGYGALFHGPLLHEVWPLAKFNVLGDASNGVITSSFLQTEFNNWNFVDNLPDDIPGVVDSITSGEGMPAYTEAVATHFPESTWANYTTAYDGGSGGQSGFYNVMLNNNNPLTALTWWNASCQFNDVMVDQADDTFTRVPANYRYYIDNGSRHTVYGSNTAYTGQAGGGTQTVVDWVDDMIAFDPLTSPAGDWQNVECEFCGLLGPFDPRPPTVPTPPFYNFLGGVVVNCP